MPRKKKEVEQKALDTEVVITAEINEGAAKEVVEEVTEEITEDIIEEVAKETEEDFSGENDESFKSGVLSDFMKPRCAVIGKNIRDNRKDRRFTVDNLADYLKLSASYIGLLERGDRCPSLKIVFKLCDLFGITPDGLLASTKENDVLGVAEDVDTYNRRQIDAITSLLRTLSESELEFVIETIKNLRKIGR